MAGALPRQQASGRSALQPQTALLITRLWGTLLVAAGHIHRTSCQLATSSPRPADKWDREGSQMDKVWEAGGAAACALKGLVAHSSLLERAVGTAVQAGLLKPAQLQCFRQPDVPWAAGTCANNGTGPRPVVAAYCIAHSLLGELANSRVLRSAQTMA